MNTCNKLTHKQVDVADIATVRTTRYLHDLGIYTVNTLQNCNTVRLTYGILKLLPYSASRRTVREIMELYNMPLQITLQDRILAGLRSNRPVVLTFLNVSASDSVGRAALYNYWRDRCIIKPRLP